MLVWQGVAMRIVISQVAEKKARCIAYFPINLTKLSQNRLGYTDIFLIILTGHPQAQDLRAVLLDDFLWRHDVAGRLRHLIAFAIEHEAVREHGLVRRAPVSGDAGQQRAVEPAAVLVGAFQVEIGRPPVLPAALPRGLRTAAWLTPDSNHTSRMSRSLSKSPPPHFGQVVPGGSSSAASRSNQTSVPCCSTNLATCSTISGVIRTLPHPRHENPGIGTPHTRWRERHQSGRFWIMP